MNTFIVILLVLLAYGFYQLDQGEKLQREEAYKAYIKITGNPKDLSKLEFLSLTDQLKNSSDQSTVIPIFIPAFR